MHNEKLSNIFTVLMFATLTIYYLFSMKGKINYLFLCLLLLQATGDIFFVKNGQANFKIGLSLYFGVNFILIQMLKNIMLKLKDNIKTLKIIPKISNIIVLVFCVAMLFSIENLITIAYALMMLLLVFTAHKYFVLHTEDISFWMLFGVSAYLICSLASSFDIFIAANIYYVSLKILAYVVAMFCITQAFILENQNSDI